MKTRFISENEISSVNDDELDRNKFAINLAKSIVEYRDNDSLTIGIIGSWGSGKSSLINLTLENLKCEKELIIIHFNPWFFSNQDNLYYQFFKLLLITLRNEELKKNNYFEMKTKPKREIFKKSKIESLRDYFNFIESSQIKINDNDFFDLENLSKYESLKTLKDNCNKYFEELDYKIIIVIDDMDRLTNEEIKKILTLVKSLADFKKFIYILSFDKQVVSKALEEYHSDYEDKFIEKIVQIQINIPDITSSQLDEQIMKYLKPIYDKYFINTYINKNNNFDQVAFYLTYFIKSIRDLKRYVNILEFYLNVFIEDINIDDCFLILAIQLFEYKIFLSIKENKQLLTSQIKIDKDDENNPLNQFYKELEKIKERISINDLKILLNNMFPMLRYHKHRNYPRVEILHKKHRIGSYIHFDKYFTLSLETNEVSTITLNNLTKPINKITIYKIFDPKNDMEHNKYLFDRLSLIIDEIPIENCESIISTLFTQGPFMKISTDSLKRINYIIDELFKKIGSKNESYNIFKRNINFESNFYIITDYLHHISVKKNKTGTPVDDLIFNEEDLNQLEKLISNEIKKQVEDGTLFYQNYLSTILDYWKSYEDKTVIKNLVLEKTKENNILIEFLKKHQLFNVSIYEKEKFESYVALDFDELRERYFETLDEEYFNLDELNKRIHQICEKENISQENKLFCEKFIKQFEEYKKTLL